MRIPGSRQEPRERRTAMLSPNSVANPLSQIANIGASVSKAVQSFQSQRDHDDLMNAKNKLNDEVNAFKMEEMSKEGESVKGTSKRYIEKYNTVRGNVANQLSDRAKKAFNHWADQRQGNEKVQFYRHEHTQSKKLASNNFQKRITAIHEDVRMNPGGIEQSFKDLEEAYVVGVGSGAIKKSELVSALTENKNKMRNFAMSERYSANSSEAIMNIDQMGFGPGEKQRWLDKYEADQEREKSQKKKRNSLARNGLLQSVPGMEAIAQEHGDVSHLRDAQSKLVGLGYENDALKLGKKADIYESSYSEFQKIRSLTLREGLEHIGTLKVSKNVDEADEELQVRNMALNFQKKRISDFKKDPAGFVQAQSIGETSEDIVSSRLELQAEQGLSVKGGYKALTNEEQAAYIEAFNSAKPAQKVAQIRELSSKYGKHTTRVLREMKLTPTASLVTHFNSSKDQELLITASTIKKAEHTNLDSISDYKIDVKNSEMMRVLNEARSLIPQDSSFSGAVKDMEQTMLNASILTGESKTGIELINRNFSTLDESDKKVFFPVGIDERDLELDLDRKKEEVKLRTIEEIKKSGKIILNEEVTESEVSRSIDNAVWINSQNGFVLIDQVTGKAISPEVRFDEIDNSIYEREYQKEIQRQATWRSSALGRDV